MEAVEPVDAVADAAAAVPRGFLVVAEWRGDRRGEEDICLG